MAEIRAEGGVSGGSQAESAAPPAWDSEDQ